MSGARREYTSGWDRKSKINSSGSAKIYTGSKKHTVSTLGRRRKWNPGATYQDLHPHSNNWLSLYILNIRSESVAPGFARFRRQNSTGLMYELYNRGGCEIICLWLVPTGAQGNYGDIKTVNLEEASSSRQLEESGSMWRWVTASIGWVKICPWLNSISAYFKTYFPSSRNKINNRFDREPAYKWS